MKARHDYRALKKRIAHKYRVRCSHCRHRRIFDKLPDFYARVPKCVCGRRAWIVDWYRQSGIERRRAACACNGYWFPHRRGSHGARGACEAAQVRELAA